MELKVVNAVVPVTAQYCSAQFCGVLGGAGVVCKPAPQGGVLAQLPCYSRQLKSLAQHHAIKRG
jgi:hypothetical protein